MTMLIHIAAILAMLASLVLIPLGLPGLWLIVVITLGLMLAGSIYGPLA